MKHRSKQDRGFLRLLCAVFNGWAGKGFRVECPFSGHAEEPAPIAGEPNFGANQSGARGVDVVGGGVGKSPVALPLVVRFAWSASAERLALATWLVAIMGINVAGTKAKIVNKNVLFNLKLLKTLAGPDCRFRVSPLEPAL